MINITKYFKENIKKDEYYDYNFGVIKYDEEIPQYYFFDDEEIIQELKRFLIQKVKEDITIRDEDKFIVFIFYLKMKGYVIEEFPEYIKRPDRYALPKFIFNEIEDYLKRIDKYNKMTLKKEKIKLINNLHISKEGYIITEQLEDIIKYISTRKARFNEMSEDEKLATIYTCIEFLLKKNGQYIKINLSEKLDIINDEKIKKYKKTLNCFRHGSKESIKERQQYNLFEKDLLIRYGLFIIESLIKMKNV